MTTKYCSECDAVKSTTEFGRNKCRGVLRYNTYCWPCQRKRTRRYYRRYRDELLRKAKKKYRGNKIEARKYGRAWRARRRLTIIHHYSNGTNKCACCDESRMDFLCVDHVHGGGNAHRRKIGGSANMYSWLVRNGLPDGFRVLCMNCNWARGQYGACPHELEERVHPDNAKKPTAVRA